MVNDFLVGMWDFDACGPKLNSCRVEGAKLVRTVTVVNTKYCCVKLFIYQSLSVSPARLATIQVTSQKGKSA